MQPATCSKRTSTKALKRVLVRSGAARLDNLGGLLLQTVLITQFGASLMAAAVKRSVASAVKRCVPSAVRPAVATHMSMSSAAKVPPSGVS